MSNTSSLPVDSHGFYQLAGRPLGFPVFHSTEQALSRLFQCFRFGLQPLPVSEVNVNPDFQFHSPDRLLRYQSGSKEKFRDAQTSI